VDLSQDSTVLNFWDSSLCLVIPFDRTLIAGRSSVSAEIFKALVLLQPHRDDLPNERHVLSSWQDDNGDENTR